MSHALSSGLEAERGFQLVETRARLLQLGFQRLTVGQLFQLGFQGFAISQFLQLGQVDTFDQFAGVGLDDFTSLNQPIT